MSDAAPAPAPMSRGELWWFDLTRGKWTALGVLRRRLGVRRLARLVAAVVYRDATHDPFKGLPAAADHNERLSRMQLRPALILDDALGQLGYGAEERAELVHEVVAESGARFLQHELRAVNRARWEGLDAAGRRGLLERLLARFFNMEADPLEGEELAANEGAGAYDLGFNVTSCHFARLCGELGRSELAPVFCAADEVFFSRPGSPLRLDRPETLASGAPRCAFRFTLT